MTEFIQTIKGVGLAGVVVRMFLAVLCGGIIGLERESKRRSAGFRTHTLICIGATLTTLTSQYLMGLGLTTDPARLGAQVIAGMGFIGAGAIIVTSRRQVKGLTTAAGLWTSAIIGLAIGRDITRLRSSPWLLSSSPRWSSQSLNTSLFRLRVP